MNNKPADKQFKSRLAVRLLNSLKKCSGEYTEELRKIIKKVRDKEGLSLIIETAASFKETSPDNSTISEAIIAAGRIVQKLKLIQKELSPEGRISGADSAEGVTAVLKKHNLPPDQFRREILAATSSGKQLLDDFLEADNLGEFRYLEDGLIETDRSSGKASGEPDSVESGAPAKNLLVSCADMIKHPVVRKNFHDCISKFGTASDSTKAFFDQINPRDIEIAYQDHREKVKSIIVRNFETPVRSLDENTDPEKKKAVLARMLNYMSDLVNYNILHRKDFYKSFIILEELHKWFTAKKIKTVYSELMDQNNKFEEICRVFDKKLDILNFIFNFEKFIIDILADQLKVRSSHAHAVRITKNQASRNLKKSEYFKLIKTALMKDLQKRVTLLFRYLDEYFMETPDLAEAEQEDSAYAEAVAEYNNLAQENDSKKKKFLEGISDINEFCLRERKIIDAINSDLANENIEQLYAMVDHIPLLKTRKRLVTYGELLRQLIDGPLKDKPPRARIAIMDRIIDDFEQTGKPPVLIGRLKYFRNSIETEPRILKELLERLKENETIDDHISFLVSTLSNDYLAVKAPNLLLRMYGMVSALQMNNPEYIDKMIGEINSLPAWKREIVSDYVGDLQNKFRENKSIIKGINRIRKEMDVTLRSDKEKETIAPEKQESVSREIDDFLNNPQFTLDDDDAETEDFTKDMDTLVDIEKSFAEDLASILVLGVQGNNQKEEKDRGSAAYADPLVDEEQITRIINARFADRIRIIRKHIENKDNPSYYSEILEVSKRIFYEIDPLQNIDDKIDILKQWMQVDYKNKKYIKNFLARQMEVLEKEKKTSGLAGSLYMELDKLETKDSQLDFLQKKLIDPAFSAYKNMISRLINQINKEPVEVNNDTVDKFLSDLDMNDQEQLQAKKDGLHRLGFRSLDNKVIAHIGQHETRIDNGLQKLKEEEEETTLKYLAVQSRNEQQKNHTFQTFNNVEFLIDYVLDHFKSPGARQKFIQEQELYFSENPEEAPFPDYPDTLRLVRYLMSPLEETGDARIRSLINRQDSKYISFDIKMKLFKILNIEKQIYKPLGINSKSIPYFAVHLSLVHPNNRHRNIARKILFLKEVLPRKEDFMAAFNINKNDISRVLKELEPLRKKELLVSNAGTAEAKPYMDVSPGKMKPALKSSDTAENAPEFSDLLNESPVFPSNSSEDPLPSVEDLNIPEPPPTDPDEIVEELSSPETAESGNVDSEAVMEEVHSGRKPDIQKFYREFKATIDNDVHDKLVKKANRDISEKVRLNAHKHYKKFQKNTNKTLHGILSDLNKGALENIASLISDTLIPSFKKNMDNEFNRTRKQELADLLSKLTNIKRYVITPCVQNNTSSIKLDQVCKSSAIDAHNRKQIEEIIKKMSRFWEKYIAELARQHEKKKRLEKKAERKGPPVPKTDSDNPAELSAEPIAQDIISENPDSGSAAEPIEEIPEMDIDQGILKALTEINEFRKPHKIIIDSAGNSRKYAEDMDLRLEVLDYLMKTKRIFTYNSGKTYIGEGKILGFYTKHKRDRHIFTQDKLYLVSELKNFLAGFGSDNDESIFKKKCSFLGIDTESEKYRDQYVTLLEKLESWKDDSNAKSRASEKMLQKRSAAGPEPEPQETNTPDHSRKKAGTDRNTVLHGSKPAASSRARQQKGQKKPVKAGNIHSDMIKHITKKRKKITGILTNMIMNMTSAEDLENIDSLYLGQHSRKLSPEDRTKNILDLIGKFNVFSDRLLGGMLQDRNLLKYSGYYDKKTVEAAFRRKIRELNG